MIRASLLMIVLSTPVLAAGAHVQPTPGAVASPDAVAPKVTTADRTFDKAFDPALTKKAEESAMARDKAWDVKLKKTMSGVCKGC